MKRQLFLLAAILFSLSSTSQSKPTNYNLDFTKQNQNIVHVKTNLDLTIAKNKFFMITHGSEKNPDGEAKFLKNLVVKNAKGKPEKINYLGEGSWEIQSAASGNFAIEYDILLDHNTENWDHCGGYDEVAYKNADGLFFTGYSLFLIPDVPKLVDIKDVSVDFTLPKNWKVSNPWIKTSKPNHFMVNNDIRFLLNNCIFVGTHYEKEIKIGDFELLFALGSSMKSSENDFIELMKPIIESATNVFNGSPKKNTSSLSMKVL